MKEINQNIFQCSSDVLVPNQGVNTDELLNSNLDLDNINGQEAPDEVEKMILSDTTVNEVSVLTFSMWPCLWSYVVDVSYVDVVDVLFSIFHIY